MSSLSLAAPQFALAALALLLSGAVKGTVGAGLPLVGISILSIFIDPRLALAILVVPIVVTNIWQVYSTGVMRSAMTRFWPLIVVFAIGTWWGAQILVRIDTDLLLGLLGMIVIGFCITSLLKQNFRVSERQERWAGPATGLLAGLLNGLTAVNGPPLVMYLVALGLEKDEFVGAYGLIVLCGAIPLAISFAAVGVLGAAELWWSVIALAPVLAGLQLGERLRKRINPDVFKRVLLLVLLLLGLNLIRRGML
jgi:uncharacterized membrane protein YfcA